jgi:hypothetical protein
VCVCGFAHSPGVRRRATGILAGGGESGDPGPLHGRGGGLAPGLCPLPRPKAIRKPGAETGPITGPVPTTTRRGDIGPGNTGLYTAATWARAGCAPRGSTHPAGVSRRGRAAALADRVAPVTKPALLHRRPGVRPSPVCFAIPAPIHFGAAYPPLRDGRGRDTGEPACDSTPRWVEGSRRQSLRSGFWDRSSGIAVFRRVRVLSTHPRRTNRSGRGDCHAQRVVGKERWKPTKRRRNPKRCREGRAVRRDSRCLDGRWLLGSTRYGVGGCFQPNRPAIRESPACSPTSPDPPWGFTGRVLRPRSGGTSIPVVRSGKVPPTQSSVRP